MPLAARVCVTIVLVLALLSAGMSHAGRVLLQLGQFVLAAVMRARPPAVVVEG